MSVWTDSDPLTLSTHSDAVELVVVTDDTFTPPTKSFSPHSLYGVLSSEWSSVVDEWTNVESFIAPYDHDSLATFINQTEWEHLVDRINAALLWPSQSRWTYRCAYVLIFVLLAMLIALMTALFTAPDINHTWVIPVLGFSSLGVVCTCVPAIARTVRVIMIQRRKAIRRAQIAIRDVCRDYALSNRIGFQPFLIQLIETRTTREQGSAKVFGELVRSRMILWKMIRSQSLPLASDDVMLDVQQYLDHKPNIDNAAQESVCFFYCGLYADHVCCGELWRTW